MHLLQRPLYGIQERVRHAKAPALGRARVATECHHVVEDGTTEKVVMLASTKTNSKSWFVDLVGGDGDASVVLLHQ